MTSPTENKLKKQNSLLALLISLIFTVSILSAALFISEEISELVTSGLKLCIRTIIPSVFPFLIITDLLIRFIKFEKVDFIRHAFEKIFRINGAALSVFICGLLAGFPTGARLSLTLYENGKISKDECERLIGISSNASPGYIICAVGGSILGNLRLGALLFFITAFSAILSGAILGTKSSFTTNYDIDLGQSYDFALSVKSSALACLNVCAFVTFFSLICGLLEKYVKNIVIVLLALPFLEIGASTSYISELYICRPFFCFMLISFCVSFSGACVYSQIKSLLTDSDISMRKYLHIKLLQGGVSILLSAILFPLLF